MNKRRIRDPYAEDARREGYAARSAYKLLQIQEAKRILAKGDRALDLGCAPGGWLQSGAKIVGKKGEIVGIDLNPVTHPMPANTRAIVADAFELDDDTLDELGAPFDSVLSDMAPATTGHGDHELSVRLCRRVLDLLPRALKPSGSMAIKVFEGGEYPDLLKDCKSLFKACKGYKPKASRDISKEIYIVGTGYTGG